MTNSIYSFKLYLIQGQAPGWEEEVCRVDAALSLGGKFYSNLRFTVKNYIIKKKKELHHNHTPKALYDFSMSSSKFGRKRKINFSSLDINMVLLTFICLIHNIMPGTQQPLNKYLLSE